MQYLAEQIFDNDALPIYSERMTIGDRLDLAMKNAGIRTQSRLSQASGVPQPTICRILKSTSSRGPEVATLRKLADACGVELAWLLDGRPDGNLSPVSLVPKRAALPAHTDDVMAAEIIELITAYAQATKSQRAMIMSSAKTAAEIAAQSQIDTAGDNN